MGFRESLTEVSSALPETFVITLMDRDGISVDTVNGISSGVDLPSYLVEVTNVFAQVERSSEQLSTGSVDELVVKTERLTTIIRRIGSEYFLVLALTPHGNTGKARYLLRVAAPKVAKELAA